MLYEVALYEPNRYERCHEVTRRFTVGSLKAAELAAKAILKPHAHSETWHSFKSARTPWIDVFTKSKNGERKRVAEYDPTLTIVPSVGELGYW